MADSDPTSPAGSTPGETPDPAAAERAERRLRRAQRSRPAQPEPQAPSLSKDATSDEGRPQRAKRSRPARTSRPARAPRAPRPPRPQALESADGFRADRLRLNEWLIGVAAFFVLVSEFVLKWFGLRDYLQATFNGLAGSGSVNGWNSFNITNWLLLITGLLGLLAWYFQATRRSPALPVVLTAMITPLGVISSLLVLHAVTISKPGGNAVVSLKPGAIVGLISIVSLTVFAYLSLREDGIREVDGPQDIETFRQRRRPVGAA